MNRTYKDIEYTLQSSNRKTGRLYVVRDGQVSLLAPERLTKAQVEQPIESKRRWIYRNLADWRDLNAMRVQREYVSGEGFLYLGAHVPQPHSHLLEHGRQDPPQLPRPQGVAARQWGGGWICDTTVTQQGIKLESRPSHRKAVSAETGIVAMCPETHIKTRE